MTPSAPVAVPPGRAPSPVRPADRPPFGPGRRRSRRISLLHPWVGPAPDPARDPTGAEDLQRATAIYVAGAFAMLVLLQRFASPGLSDLAVLTPLMPVYVAWGLMRGLLEIDRTRLKLWLAAAGLGALVVPLQLAYVKDPIVSLTSWGLFFVVWTSSVVRCKDRRRDTFVIALRHIAHIAAALALLCLVFIATQLVGIPYTDWLAKVVPAPFLLQKFVITYPIVYGSSLYRANGWIGLEPSFVSMQLGIGLVAAFLGGTRLRVLVVIIGGLVAATAGSGMAIVAVAFVVMLGYPVRNDLVRYLPLALGGALALVLTPFGQAILKRLTSENENQSSTSLRGILPYQYVWPRWVYDPAAVILGRGPGASQKIVDDSGILGLLTPSPLKIFVEYGLIVGIVIAACLLFAYVGGPSRSLSVTMLVSLWMLQPGTSAIVAVLPLFVVSTWWAPRIDRVLESDSSTYAAARSWLRRLSVWRPGLGVSRWRWGRRRRRGSAAAAGRVHGGGPRAR